MHIAARSVFNQKVSEKTLAARGFLLHVAHMVSQARRVRLPHLDGLRGWAALFVVFHHVWQFVVGQVDMGPLPRWFTIMTVFKYGPLAVTVFIVISGYSLMLPVAASPHGALSGGLWGFVARRARRVLPAYMATLVFSLLLLALHPAMRESTQTQWDMALPAMTPANLILHGLLLHNLFDAFQYKLNPPLWSVALEWQIYFAFALVLLPCWRRFGLGGLLALCSCIAFVPPLLGGAYLHLWYVASFSLGMLGAQLEFAEASRMPTWIQRVPWRVISVACLVPVAYWLVVLHGDLNDTQRWGPLVVVHIAMSIATVAFLIDAASAVKARRASLVVRALSGTASGKLGQFSYSVYLLHYPLIAACCIAMRAARIAPLQMFTMLVAFTPAVLLICYGFHLLFEKPYMKVARALNEQPASRSPDARAMSLTAHTEAYTHDA